MPARKRIVALVALLALAFALVPVFQSNIIAPGDAYYFANWDKRSQSLVLGKIAQDASHRGSTAFGLAAASPDPLMVYDDFDALSSGAAPAAQRYDQYASSLGLQGYGFEALHQFGCDTVGCLTAAESTAFSLVFVLFCVLLALALRRSAGLTVLVCGIFSPWVVSAAHNLYWVPWSWLLPACAAAAATLARTRRSRLLWVAVAGVATGVKAAMGYEYLTATTLLAASVPVLAELLRPRTTLREALLLALKLFCACVIGFLCVLAVHLLVAGGGSITSGLNFVVWDALRRTVGSASLDPDPLVNASLRATTFDVLSRYAFGWSTSLFAAGQGGPYPSISIGPWGFWVLVLASSATVLIEVLQHRAGSARRAGVLLVAAAPPLSWLVLGKSHSFAETNETYALWYWILIPMMVWVLVDRIRRSSFLEVMRNLSVAPRPPAGASAPARPDQTW